MCSPGIDGEGELRGNRLTQVHLEKWPFKMECVSVCVGGGLRTSPDNITVLRTVVSMSVLIYKVECLYVCE